MSCVCEVVCVCLYVYLLSAHSDQTLLIKKRTTLGKDRHLAESLAWLSNTPEEAVEHTAAHVDALFYGPVSHKAVQELINLCNRRFVYLAY